jgi:hypothetical protein
MTAEAGVLFAVRVAITIGLMVAGYYIWTVEIDVKKMVQKIFHVELKTPEPDSPERPWISLGDPTAISPMKFDARGASVTLRFPIRHTGGRNPALHISFRTMIFAVTDERSAPHLERDRFVASLKAEPDGLVFGERTLFQGDSAVMDYDYRVPATEIEAAARSLNDESWKNTFLPVYVACVIYKIAPNGGRHFSCIVGDIHPADPSGLSGAFDITKDDYPAAKLDAKQLYAPYID